MLRIEVIFNLRVSTMKRPMEMLSAGLVNCMGDAEPIAFIVAFYFEIFVLSSKA